ncbi:hypothetical protein EVAR_25914_1 [Eumeta japonica]|uniref:Uncharacterized protein n=1 Tax=Eumeta variegata TaxID=151549 RepID=A0A4C1W1M6_EUMVA|nr:hypothetical protein EVAR_25914_1 [Eumeta japonica]
MLYAKLQVTDSVFTVTNPKPKDSLFNRCFPIEELPSKQKRGRRKKMARSDCVQRPRVEIRTLRHRECTCSACSARAVITDATCVATSSRTCVVSSPRLDTLRGFVPTSLFVDSAFCYFHVL